MTESLPQPSPLEVESRKINSLVEQYKEKLGPFDVVPVGEVGFVVQPKRQLPMAGNDWFLFDYDDTLRATTEVKGKRLDLYKKYAHRVGIDLPDNYLATVMETTDKFSRWEDTPGGGDSYHPNAHMSALDWSTRKLHGNSKQKNGAVDDTQSVVTDIQQTLTRVKQGLNREDTGKLDDPFHFRAPDKKLILQSKIPWSKDIEEIFM